MDAMYSSKLFDAPDTKSFWEFEAPSKTFVQISSNAKNDKNPTDKFESHVDAPFCNLEEIKH